MATSGQVNGDDLGGEHAYIAWQLASQNIPGNYSTINWQVGWTFAPFFCRGLRQGSARVNGVLVYNDQDPGDGVHQFSSGHNHSPLIIASGQINVGHNADGTKTFNLSVSIRGWEGGGPNFLSDGSASFDLPTIPRNPGAPSTPVISEIEQTSVRLDWTPNPADGLPNTSYTISYGTATNATGATTTSSGTNKIITGLNPGVRYYFKVKAHNSVGEGPYSSISNALTIAGAYLRHSGTYKRAIPYVKQAGVWKLARPYGKILGVWKKSTN